MGRENKLQERAANEVLVQRQIWWLENGDDMNKFGKGDELIN